MIVGRMVERGAQGEGETSEGGNWGGGGGGGMEGGKKVRERKMGEKKILKQSALDILSYRIQTPLCKLTRSSRPLSRHSDSP